jgi:hypothetical protein
MAAGGCSAVVGPAVSQGRKAAGPRDHQVSWAPSATARFALYGILQAQVRALPGCLPSSLRRVLADGRKIGRPATTGTPGFCATAHVKSLT